MSWEKVVYAREDLFQQVWAEPVTHVAKRIGISDVALAKICRGMGIPLRIPLIMITESGDRDH